MADLGQGSRPDDGASPSRGGLAGRQARRDPVGGIVDTMASGSVRNLTVYGIRLKGEYIQQTFWTLHGLRLAGIKSSFIPSGFKPN